MIVKLIWHGHACFSLECGEFSVVFDPYSPGSVPGIALPPLSADAVLCSHGHGDHSYAEGVKQTRRTLNPRLFSQLDCLHDDSEGKKRGTNQINIVDCDGIRVAHLGDLGHMLSHAEIEKLGRIDVLLIPVGGFYTIDAATAAALVRLIAPAVTVPMHYRGEGFGFDVIAPVDDFLKLSENVHYLENNVLELSTLPEVPETVVFRCPLANE